MSISEGFFILNVGFNTKEVKEMDMDQHNKGLYIHHNAKNYLHMAIQEMAKTQINQYQFYATIYWRVKE